MINFANIISYGNFKSIDLKFERLNVFLGEMESQKHVFTELPLLLAQKRPIEVTSDIDRNPVIFIDRERRQTNKSQLACITCDHYHVTCGHYHGDASHGLSFNQEKLDEAVEKWMNANTHSWGWFSRIIYSLERLRQVGGVLCIEQPEIGLSLKMQKALADLISDVLETQPKAQIFFDTYSHMFVMQALKLSFKLPVQIFYVRDNNGGEKGKFYVAPTMVDGKIMTSAIEQEFAIVGQVRRELLEARRRSDYYNK